MILILPYCRRTVYVDDMLTVKTSLQCLSCLSSSSIYPLLMYDKVVINNNNNNNTIFSIQFVNLYICYYTYQLIIGVLGVTDEAYISHH